jgi:hypothetical protein
MHVAAITSFHHTLHVCMHCLNMNPIYVLYLVHGLFWVDMLSPTVFCVVLVYLIDNL